MECMEMEMNLLIRIVHLLKLCEKSVCAKIKILHIWEILPGTWYGMQRCRYDLRV